MIYYCDDFVLDYDLNKLKKLATEERVKNSQNYNSVDKFLSLLSFNLLQFAINNEYNKIISKFQCFTYNEFGKPYLQNELANIFFSISHIKRCVAVAISSKEVGIDVCDYRKIKASTIKGTMSEKEQNEILKDEKSFAKFWSIKEAFSKQKGESILNNLKEIDYSYVQKDFENYSLSCCGGESNLLKISFNQLISFINNN